jgi:hypothetical protein
MPAKINLNHCRFSVSPIGVGAGPIGAGAGMIMEVTFFIPKAQAREIIALRDEKGYDLGETTGLILKPAIAAVIGSNMLYAYRLFDCVEDQDLDTGTFNTDD